MATPLPRPPVSNPRPRLSIDGVEPERASALLQALEVNEQEGGLASLELRLSNVASLDDGSAGAAFEDERELRLGSRITVALGDAQEPQEVFRGIVTGLEADYPGDGPPELVVHAEDALQQARMHRRTRVHRDRSLADLLQALAGDLGLQAEVSGLDRARGTWVQLNESDLAFVRRLLRARGADLQVVGETLQAAPRTEIRREAIALSRFQDLQRLRLFADLAHQVTAVTSAGWDPLRGEAVSGRGERRPQPGRGRSGAELLREALGEREEHVGQVAVTHGEEAQALADALFERRARAFVTAEGTAWGHPRIRVGCELELSGISPRFDNTYQVVATCHRYSVREGYLTDFRAECAALGEPA